MQTLDHVSPSQISTFRQCPRKHWIEKVLGIKTPTHPSAAFGTLVHATIEHRIEKGEWPQASEGSEQERSNRVALAGWKFVPQGKKLIEAVLQLDGYALPVTGRVDMIAPEDSVVIDHKTTSNFRYMKTSVELKSDPQAVLYVAWAMLEGHIKPNALTFRHIVYLTTGHPEARTVQTQFSLPELQGACRAIGVEIDTMAANAKITDPKQVAGAMESVDPSPCKAYGGCFHQARCKGILGKGAFSEVKTETKKERESKMNIEEMLAKKKAAQGVAVAAFDPANEGRIPTVAVVDVGTVNPPDGTNGVVVEVAPATTATTAPPKKFKKAKELMPNLFDAPVETPRVGQVIEQVLDTATQAAAQAAEDARLQRISFPPPDDDAPATTATTAPPQTSQVSDQWQCPTLYVGCLPSNEQFLMLDHWLQPLYAAAAQSLGTDYWNQADFGKGKTALAALILHKAKNEPLPLVLVVDPRLPASDVALEILRPLYKRIVLRFS